MSMMDTMIVTTASTTIRQEFQISVSTLQWALNAYNIAIAATLLIGVAFGERWGRRRIYSWGILIFTVGSVFCALAVNISELVAARVIEGIGASVMTPMSMAILTNALPPAERGKALGIWSGIGGLALIVGPSLGGLIVATLAWQWIFWINVPIGLVTIYLVSRRLPESRGQASRLNLGDALLLMVAMAGLVWSLTAVTGSQSKILVGVIGTLSLIIGGLFIWHQRQSPEPLVPLTYFHARPFSGGNLATALLYAAMYGVVFFLPQFFQVVGHANALTAGLELLPWTGTLVVVAPFAGRAVDKWGERTVAMVGLILQGLGYWGLVVLTNHYRTYGGLIIPLIIAGAGLSMAGPALQKAVLGAVPRTAIGKASGIYNVCRLLGGAIGTAIAVIVFYQVGSGADAVTFTRGFQAAMACAGSLSLVGIFFSRWLAK